MAINRIERITLNLLDKINPPAKAFAHCDIPCGIYETDSMVHAADTVVKMVEKLQEAEQQAPVPSDKQATLDFRNKIIRMVHTKEEFAQKCKQELLILWTDYFKEEHLMKFPDLHSVVWKACKLCSSAKRTVDMKTAQDLKLAVQKVADIFHKTKT